MKLGKKWRNQELYNDYCWKSNKGYTGNGYLTQWLMLINWNYFMLWTSHWFNYRTMAGKQQNYRVCRIYVVMITCNLSVNWWYSPVGRCTATTLTRHVIIGLIVLTLLDNVTKLDTHTNFSSHLTPGTCPANMVTLSPWRNDSNNNKYYLSTFSNVDVYSLLKVVKTL